MTDEDIGIEDKPDYDMSALLTNLQLGTGIVTTCRETKTGAKKRLVIGEEEDKDEEWDYEGSQELEEE